MHPPTPRRLPRRLSSCVSLASTRDRRGMLLLAPTAKARRKLPTRPPQSSSIVFGGRTFPSRPSRPSSSSSSSSSSSLLLLFSSSLISQHGVTTKKLSESEFLAPFFLPLHKRQGGSPSILHPPPLSSPPPPPFFFSSSTPLNFSTSSTSPLQPHSVASSLSSPPIDRHHIEDTLVKRHNAPENGSIVSCAALPRAGAPW